MPGGRAKSFATRDWIMRSPVDPKAEELRASLTAAGFGPLTLDEVMGGRVRLIQLADGYRAGMDAVLLAAAVPARAGERALDVGAATGAGALCLAARVPGVTVSGIEIQPALIEIGRANIALNRCEGRVSLVQGSILERTAAFAPASFDHVFVNPPYLEDGQAPAPAVSSKTLAHVASETALADWVAFAAAMAKSRATLTFIFRADRIHDLLGPLHPFAGEMVCFPLWPRQGRAASLILVQARKGLHGASAVAPGLVLHGADESYTPETERVLREGVGLDLGRFRRPSRAP
jgi:tRNA1(Val) A37 N6-methylase TrmN6